MTHDAAPASLLNEKFREDALHAFISGLKKSLKVAVFPAEPRDLPTALALAQEAESSTIGAYLWPASPDMLKKKQMKQIIIDHLRGKIPHNGQVSSALATKCSCTGR